MYTMPNRIQRKVMPSRSLRCGAGIVVDAPGGLYIWLCVGFGVVGLEWGEAVQGEAEAGDPFEQPLEMRLVDDRPGDVCLTVVGADRHPVERRGVAGSEFSFDDEAVAGM